MALLHRSFHFELSFEVIYHSAKVIRTAAPPGFFFFFFTIPSPKKIQVICLFIAKSQLPVIHGEYPL